jgi:hypothetical protein
MTRRVLIPLGADTVSLPPVAKLHATASNTVLHNISVTVPIHHLKLSLSSLRFEICFCSSMIDRNMPLRDAGSHSMFDLQPPSSGSHEAEPRQHDEDLQPSEGSSSNLPI